MSTAKPWLMVTAYSHPQKRYTLTKDAVLKGQSIYGMRPLALLSECGLLNQTDLQSEVIK